MTRLMWIESKAKGLAGPARIGWVKVRQRGKRLEYRGRVFLSLRGRGFKANYFDARSLEPFWISGCRRDGRDALYGTTVEIDDDACVAYWTEVRGMPERAGTRRGPVPGKNG